MERKTMPEVCRSQFERLTELKSQISSPSSLITLKGFFKLTKTENGWIDALAIRDHDLEVSVEHWISERSSYETILERYHEYDPSLQSKKAPQHYPLRILSGIGSISSGKNIFMFFPEALGIEANDETDVLGLEFIDVWSNMFRRSIFECVKRVFSTQDQFQLLVPLQANLERTIFLSSIFHEIGHRVGPYRVSPTRAPEMNLTEFQTNVLGELATDSILIRHLPEFPEVVLFVILQRIFWFGRRGFADDPLSAQINNDNDAWIGAYLWSKLIQYSVIELSAGGLKFNFAHVKNCFDQIIASIDELARISSGQSNQTEIVLNWMSRQVPCERGRFFLPPEMKDIFSLCHDIPEVPHFHPIFPYSKLSEISLSSMEKA
jgi:hypothetical protein